MPAAPKNPQDRKAKAVATVTPTPVNVYAFTWQGQEHTLPAGETAAERIPGRVLRDAYLDGEDGQMRLSLRMLEAVDADPAALEALYDMPAPQMLDHIAAWMNMGTVAGDPSLGESSGSSV